MTAVSDQWILFPRRRPRPALRLLCFGYAGGGAATFFDWPEALPVDVEVAAIRLPGRESRIGEVPFQRLPPLLDALTDALAPLLAEPCVIFGHSMGALIGFELSRRMRQAGLPAPRRLLVSGLRAPNRAARRDRLHDLPDTIFLAKLRELGGIPPAVLEHGELIELLLPTIRADFAVCETYVHEGKPPLDCPISLFGGLNDPETTLDDIAAWRGQTRAAFSSHLLPGRHFFIHDARRELLEIVRRELTSDLREVNL